MLPKLSRASLTVAALAVLASPTTACPNCKKDFAFGTPVAIGNGMAWTWVRFDKETKKPVSLGVTLTETALQGLPTEVPANMVEMEEILPLPRGVKDLPFTHATLDWNPKGHVPPGIYDVPHFDFHFYVISEKSAPASRSPGQAPN